MQEYFIFGLQRSGTNFLETLLNKNFEVKKLNNRKSWKHSITDPKEYDPKFPTIHIYKNPYTWLESICFRNEVDWRKRQLKYPSDEIHEDEDFMLGTNKMNMINVIKTYRDFELNWFRPATSSYINIRYEDLLEPTSRDFILSEIETSFGFKRLKRIDWIVPPKGRVSQSKDYNEKMENYYKSLKPLYLTNKQIQAINDVLGTDLLKKLGYPIL